MTYVVAWKTKKTFFLSSDSAITVEGNTEKWPRNQDTVSSFNERQVYDDDHIVEEALLKIHNINDKILIGYSGDVDTSVEVIEMFRIKLLRDQKQVASAVLQECVDEVLNPTNKSWISLVLGTIVDDTPVLVSYNSGGNLKIRTDETIVQLGSMTDRDDIIESTAKTIKALNDLEEQGAPKNSLLLIINTIVQSYGIHNVLMEMGVGGIITGAMLDAEGVQWQKDSVYYLLNPLMQMEKVIALIFRSNGAIMHFNAGFATKALFASSSSLTLDLPKLIEESIAKRNETFAESDYYVFFRVDHKRIVIVSKESNLLNDWFSIKILKLENDESQIQMYVSNRLQNILALPKSDSVDVIMF